LAQVIAIILIFEEDHKSNGSKSCLLEIQTGEGKSIVLAGLACFLALKGYKVYQLCYSKYLVKRDY
jgi:preprotein translocase subunit SecA